MTDGRTMNDAIWILALTEHVPFRQIADAVRQDRVLRAITRLNDALKRAGYDAAPIGVAALNVHGGEGGLYGREEIDEIGPAIAAGWVSGLVEAFSRKPRVKDLETLPEDILSMRGFWKNKVTRILLVVVFTNLGSALGTFVAIPLMLKY